MDQLQRTDAPPLFYALAVRLDNGWGSFIVISRAKLKELWDDGCGSENEKSGDLELNIQFRLEEEEQEAGGHEAANEQKRKALCGAFNLTDYINAWESMPPFKPPVAKGFDVQDGGAEVAVGGGEARTDFGGAGDQAEDISSEPPQT